MVANHKKHVAETQLKKAYSVLNQMVQRSEVDNGSAVNWNWENTADPTKADAFFDKYFAPYLNLNGKKVSAGSKRYFDIYANNSQSVSWYYNNFDNTDWRLLSDGTALMFSSYAAAGNVYLGGFSIILPSSVKKKRLVIGRDVFSFAINYSSNKSAVTVFPQSWGNWNCNTVENNRFNFNNRCNGYDDVGISPASACSVLLYCNGWKVPDDYPIKF